MEVLTTKGTINWFELESGVSQIVNVKRYGRAKQDLRVMLGLSMLQAMYNFSDCLTSETLEENILAVFLWI